MEAMMVRFGNCMAVAAFALVTLGMRAQAHADGVVVRVDNYTNPSGYSNAVSSGTLEVCIYVDGSSTAHQCINQVLDVIANWDYVFNSLGVGRGWQNVSKISFRFHSPGQLDDLLTIDQFEFLDQYLVLRNSWGVDNETCFCFSSDSGDFSNSHCGSPNTLSNDYLYWNQ
jgi:hypothetical protein